MGRSTESGIDPPRSVALFRFHGGLESLLVRRYRDEPVRYSFRDNPGIKDPIEAMGVPHTEVDVILVNARAVAFDYPLQQGDLVDVYPVRASLPVATPLRLAPQPPEPIGFILDVHLGKLARRLRLLGFDCCYRNDRDDVEIMTVALRERRIILTRDLGILKHRQVRHGYLVRSDQVDHQIREVLTRYALSDRVQLWRRCLVCNGLLKQVPKEAILDRLEPKTRLYYETFHRCTDCARIYWQGSHFAGIRQWLESFLNGSGGA